MILHIDVKNKVATYQKRDGCIVCGNGGYQIEFNFDNEWNGITKQAVFVVNGNTIYSDIKHRTKLSFTENGVIDANGTVQTSGSAYAEKHHTNIVALSDLIDGLDGYCVGHFDTYTHYPKILFFSDGSLSSFISGLTASQIGNKETLTAAEIQALAKNVSGATHVAFNSDYESGEQDSLYIITKDGLSGVCDVPIVRNVDKVVVGVHSESEEMTTTGTEIPCKKSILCR